jgi:hypothetical protein
LCVAWAAAWIGGTAIFAAYEATPGNAGSQTTRWPADCPIERPVDRITIMVFIHPRCSCTSATLAELAATLARASEAPEVIAVIVEPPAATTQWSRGAKERVHATIPTARVHGDRTGLAAARFGVQTSGHILVYDRLGSLRFSGGLTPARGQRGENIGQAALAALLANQPPPRTECEVFGCPLFDSPPIAEKR